MAFQDERRQAFFIIQKSATRTIRRHFDGRRASLGLAVYMAIVELANDARAETFQKPRKAIADRAGCGLRALDDYVGELEACGLIRVERIQFEGRNLPNGWTLLEPASEPDPDGAQQPATSANGHGASAAPPRSEGTATSSKQGGASAALAHETRTTEEDNDSRERERSAPAQATTELPVDGGGDQVLEQVWAVLQRVAEVKKPTVELSRAGLAKAIADHPNRDHVALAGDMEHWLIHGTGQSAKTKDVVATYRNQLKRAPASLAARRTPGGALASSSGRDLSYLDQGITRC